MELKKVIELVTKRSIDRASQVLSKIIRAGARIEHEQVNVVDISQVTERMMEEGGASVLASLVNLEGDISFKFLFLIKIEDACVFTDIMLRNEPGTTKQMDKHTRSAIQEIGNIMSGSIANTFSKDFDINIMPSVPMVFDDFKAGIFSNFILEGAKEEDIIWLIQIKFWVVRMQIECEMFLIPDWKSFGLLEKTINGEKQ